MENGLNKKDKYSDLLFMLPACLFVLSILIVRLRLFSMPMSNIYWTEATDTSTLSDLFSYWKAITIMASAGLAVLLFVIGYFKDAIRIKKSFLLIPVLIYSAFVVLSLLFSDYKYFALRGMNEHFEGTVVLLSYMVMVVFLANSVDSARRLKAVIYCVFGTTLLLGILGVTQATGNDFLSTVAGQKMMTPNYMLDTGVKSWDMIDSLAASGQKAYDFTFQTGKVYQTVYNINYVPFYLSLLIPVSAILFVAMGTNEGKVKKGLSFVFLALYGLYLYNFFAASSSSGYFGLAAIFVAALIVFRKHLKRWGKYIICLIVVLGLVLGLTTNYWIPEIRKVVGYGIDSWFSPVYADDAAEIQYEYENDPGSVWAPIDFIESSDDSLRFSINGNVLRISRDAEHASHLITDDMGDALYLTSYDGHQGVYQILDDRFHDFLVLRLVQENDQVLVRITTKYIQGGYIDWDFLYMGGTYLYRNRAGKLVPLSIIPHVDLFKNYSFGSGRGRIWNTTFPMLKHALIWGSGADTYSFVYPQNDYATLYNTTAGLSVVTDKAHNLYMQYWVNTGLISLLAWLAMVGYYLVGAVKQFRKRGFTDFCDFVNGGIFCGILGFLAVAFFNDGSVNTMPMFYTMLGTGLAINMRDRWPVGEGAGVPDAGEGKKKKEKKAKPQAGVMPEM